MKQQTLQAHKQHGSTIVGFVVGLLVGLGIALSVAVYVTRVPVPFVDRGVSRKAAQDVEEAERNQGWNPNAGLAGSPATLPPPVVSPEPAPASAGAEAADSPAATAADKPVAGQPAPAPTQADPLGDLMRARTGADNGAAPAAGAAVPADPFTYFVQAGAFRAPEEAEAQRARLAMLGMAADISEREQSGRPVFRVRVGPFSQKAMADATLEQLEVNGVDAALVRVQR
ncbi:MAG: SPOR domain-containing protein [Hydrogenophaga sp.]|jgi:cell division protein FtsN|nr:SPOR domain-containing protein [Hydrogenophaga sp.]MDP3323124.1 SPOR domain-containing protein [Hydrogenophaga sp.]